MTTATLYVENTRSYKIGLQSFLLNSYYTNLQRPQTSHLLPQLTLRKSVNVADAANGMRYEDSHTHILMHTCVDSMDSTAAILLILLNDTCNNRVCHNLINVLNL